MPCLIAVPLTRHCYVFLQLFDCASSHCRDFHMHSVPWASRDRWWTCPQVLPLVVCTYWIGNAWRWHFLTAWSEHRICPSPDHISFGQLRLNQANVDCFMSRCPYSILACSPVIILLFLPVLKQFWIIWSVWSISATLLGGWIWMVWEQTPGIWRDHLFSLVSFVLKYEVEQGWNKLVHVATK